jgi:hypothetical protein
LNRWLAGKIEEGFKFDLNKFYSIVKWEVCNLFNGDNGLLRRREPLARMIHAGYQR